MKAIFQKVHELIRHKAVHRRGFVITDATPVLAAGHAVSEAAEALDSILFNRPIAETTDEIADTIACLVHLAIMLGIEQHEITEAALKKLDLRFKVTTIKDVR